jgi:MFS transporter, YNFM family, putative membrane transport protein
MHCVQPLLPVFADTFHLSAAEASLAVSVTTGVLGPAILIAGMISDRIGRIGILIGSLAISGVLTVAVAVAPSWESLLVFRFLSGLSLAGGSAIGGMAGRVVAGAVTDYFGWRVAVGGIAVLTLIASVVFWRIVPASRNFQPRSIHPRRIAIGLKEVFRDPQLPLLYAEGGLLMGAFYAVYNYIAFRMLGAPFNLSHAEIGSIFTLYILGSLTSSSICAVTRRFGRMTSFIGLIVVMLAGVTLTLVASLWVVILGTALLTIGYFGAHAIASSQVASRRASYPALASGLYFLAFYLGASLFGTLAGLTWTHGGWAGVVIFAAVTIGIALALAWRLKAVSASV